MNGQIGVYLFKGKMHDSIHRFGLTFVFQAFSSRQSDFQATTFKRNFFTTSVFHVTSFRRNFPPSFVFHVTTLKHNLFAYFLFSMWPHFYTVFAMFQTLGSRFGLATVVLFLSGSHSQRVSRFTNLSGFGKGKWVISKDSINRSVDLILL